MSPSRRVGRTLRVLATATRIVLGYRWHAFRARRLPPADRERCLSAYHRRSAERIFRTVTQLQGLMIKVGQVIGARADIFPDEYIEVLSRLHDTVPPRPFDVIRRVVEAELGAPLDRHFAEFDRAPLASASLAQVHRARLHDGRVVAVKVQYPEIDRIVAVDLQNVRLLNRLAKLVLRDFDFTPLVDELSANVPLELDFLNEGRNAERIARNFAGDDRIVVPRVHWEYTTRRVLTLEFIDGVKISDTDALLAAGHDLQAVARLVAETYLKQIFADGFFHADPHPGNLFVQPGPKLVLLDFGLAKELPPAFVRGFVQLTLALLSGNGAALAQAFRDLGFRTRHADDGVFEQLGQMMVTRLSRNSEFNRNRALVLQFQNQMLRIFRENPLVRVPGEFLLLGRVMGLMAGLGTRLGSEVNLLDLVPAYLPADRARVH